MSQRVLMPRLSQDMETGQVVEWLKVVGEPVEQGEPLLVVETDKANMDVDAPASGFLRRIVAQVGEDAPVGSVLAIIAGEDEALPDDEATAGSSTPPVGPADATTDALDRATPGIGTGPRAGTPQGGGRRPVSPAARRLTSELGLDIGLIHGSGESGLVTEADVRSFVASGDPSPVRDAVTEVPLVGVRRRMADRLAASRRTVADVTTVIDVDMTRVAALRQQQGFSYTVYVAWATARSLAAFPALNASFAEDRILLRHDIHLGVAVALDDGLVVPVVRNADRLGLPDLASTIEGLATAARAGTAGPEALSGSTFTLTNSGTYGSLFFTPIVNLPEVAILGMGRVADAAVVREGRLEAGKTMYLCLTYDHRAVDGADAVRFVAEVKRTLETLGGTNA